MSNKFWVTLKQHTRKLAGETNLESTSLDSLQYDQKLKAVEEKLLKIQRLVRALTSNFQDVSIGIMDKNMRFVPIDVNDVIEINPVSSSLRKQQPSSNLPPLNMDILLKFKIAFSGMTVHNEINSNGMFYATTAIPLVDSNNRVNEILCVIQNLTERKRMEQELLNAFIKEKELGELKSRFVTMASHEFRTPLTSILASTFLLENLSGSDYDKEKTIHTNRVKRSVNNLTTILNEFLSLQKLEENRINVVHTKINIPEFIQDDLIGEMDVVKKSGQSIEYTHSGESMLSLDHHILWSIITNLLSNSIKYSKAGDTIQIASEFKDNTFKLVVNDNGIGIPEDEQKNIFGRFYRARNALNIEGTGLGLHIVQKYVHLLNGTITFESQLDKGTIFTVILPIVLSEEIVQP